MAVTVKALFEYAATQEDELTLREGDIVENVQQDTGGWWTGTLNGKTGMFPDNFVEVVPTKAKAPPSKPPPPKAAVPPPGAVALPMAAAAPAPAAVAPKAPAAGAKKKKAKCVFDYDPVQDDELMLKVGDIVAVLRDDVDGWCEGEVHGRQGVFPSNFVEMLSDDADTAAAAGALAAEPEELQHKKVVGVGFGNIFQGGVPTLKKTTAPPPVTAKDRPESSFVAPQLRQTIKRPPGSAGLSGAPPVPASSKPAETRPLYRVLFDYTAANEDELSLKSGQHVRLVKKEDGGWWQGDLDGKVGWFPDNYVEPAPEDEKKDEPAPASAAAPAHPPAAAPAPMEKRAILPPGKAMPPPVPGAKPKAEEPPPPPLPAKPKDEPAAAPPPSLPPKQIAKEEAPPRPAVAVPSEPALPRTNSSAKAVPEPPSKPAKPPAPIKAKPKEDVEHKDEPAPAPAPAAAPQPMERTLSNAFGQLKKVDSQAGRLDTVAAASSAASDAKIAEVSELVRTMREEMDKMKKQIVMLTTELDEEKALRSKMQIEIDRVKKLVQL